MELGIGGAIIMDNQVIGTEGKPNCELGHMVIQKDGILCNCGRKGCFERYASMKAFKDNLRSSLHLDELTKGQQLLELIRKNSPSSKNYEVIERVMTNYIEYLSIGILNLSNIFDPEMIGIGGSFVYFKDVFLTRLEQRLKEAKRDDVKIETAILGNDAGIIGATL